MHFACLNHSLKSLLYPSLEIGVFSLSAAISVLMSLPCYTFRFYSQQWKTWAACFIQSAWRRYFKRKLDGALREDENKLQTALAKDAGVSPSLGATIYASKFAANILRTVHPISPRQTRVSERPTPLLLQKPSEPDFTKH